MVCEADEAEGGQDGEGWLEVDAKQRPIAEQSVLSESSECEEGGEDEGGKESSGSGIGRSFLADKGRERVGDEAGEKELCEVASGCRSQGESAEGGGIHDAVEPGRAAGVEARGILGRRRQLV